MQFTQRFPFGGPRDLVQLRRLLVVPFVRIKLRQRLDHLQRRCAFASGMPHFDLSQTLQEANRLVGLARFDVPRSEPAPAPQNPIIIGLIDLLEAFRRRFHRGDRLGVFAQPVLDVGGENKGAQGVPVSLAEFPLANSNDALKELQGRVELVHLEISVGQLVQRVGGVGMLGPQEPRLNDTNTFQRGDGLCCSSYP